jgi:hypothetical protein
VWDLRRREKTLKLGRERFFSSSVSLFFLLSLWERTEVRVQHSSVTALTLALSQREREKIVQAKHGLYKDIIFNKPSVNSVSLW